MQKNSYLVTGSAGFIGFHIAERLLKQGHKVIGLDNLNDYYPVELKLARNDILKKSSAYQFIQGDLADRDLILNLFKNNQFASVFHMGAQAGVRYSIENPEVYLRSNIDGTFHILEGLRQTHPMQTHLILASSSSVYGLSEAFPFKETDAADRPVSLYGATKRSNELMAHSYSHLFGLKISAVRFFTVYGPWGRPDMALFKFVKNILSGSQIEVFNNGDMIRDFTYVDDIVDGLFEIDHVRGKLAEPKYEVINIGSSKPKTLIEFIRAIEKAVGKPAQLKMMPFQAGDVYKTFADVSKLHELTGYSPRTSIDEGIGQFVKWYRSFYHE